MLTCMFFLKMLIFTSIFFFVSFSVYKPAEIKSLSDWNLEIITSIISNPKPLNRVKLLWVIITNRQSSLGYHQVAQETFHDSIYNKKTYSKSAPSLGNVQWRKRGSEQAASREGWGTKKYHHKPAHKWNTILPVLFCPTATSWTYSLRASLHCRSQDNVEIPGMGL